MAMTEEEMIREWKKNQREQSIYERTYFESNKEADLILSKIGKKWDKPNKFQMIYVIWKDLLEREHIKDYEKKEAEKKLSSDASILKKVNENIPELEKEEIDANLIQKVLERFQKKEKKQNE